MASRRRFTAQEKLECVQRELRQRRHVYPRRVTAEKMTQAFADEQLALMEAIVADYEELVKSERLI